MKQVNENLITIYIDVDNTLTPDEGITFYKSYIDKIKKLSEKANIYIWSIQGEKYTKRICLKAGLIDYICGYLIKPDLIIDDLYFDEFCKTRIIKDGNWDLDLHNQIICEYINDKEEMERNINAKKISKKSSKLYWWKI